MVHNTFRRTPKGSTFTPKKSSRLTTNKYLLVLSFTILSLVFYISTHSNIHNTSSLTTLPFSSSSSKDLPKYQIWNTIDQKNIMENANKLINQRIEFELNEEYEREVAYENYQQKRFDLEYYSYYEEDSSKDTTVVGLAYTNDIKTFKRFVGSLRASGYQGNVIIGIDPNKVGPDIMNYLQGQQVIVKQLYSVPCNYNDSVAGSLCYAPYGYLKSEWSFIPLTKDWLMSCEQCTGPVIVTAIHDVYFQANPFGKGMPIVKRLQLYEQHPGMDTLKHPSCVLLRACKWINMDKRGYMPLLSAAITIGPKIEVMEHLGFMTAKMKEWMKEPECYFRHSKFDDGTAILNYLRVRRYLPKKTRKICHRCGIVNHVGYDGRLALGAHVQFWKFKGLSREESLHIPYEGANDKNWIDSEYLLTDSEGFFMNVLFGRSAIVHQYSEFGPQFERWLDAKMGPEGTGFFSSVNTTTTTTTTQEVVEEQGNQIAEKVQIIESPPEPE